MSLFWKIILWTIGVGVVFIIGVFIFTYLKLNIPDLEVSPEDSTSKKIEKADAWLKSLQEKNHFNGAVLLIKNDTVLLKNTYGYMDGSQKELLTNSAMFRLASVSKQFTATGIMLLKSQGKLDFDNTIVKYLPELPYEDVTIRHLLNHTSGIPDIYMNFPNDYKQEVGELLTNVKVVQLLAKSNKPLQGRPLDAYAYSNTGYVLLAAIIERVSEQTFENFMQTELFEKVGLNETRVWNLISKDKTFKNKTASFDNVLGDIEVLTPGILDGVAGDGAVFSSINDFEKWNQFWYTNDLISKSIMNEAFKQPKLNNGKLSNYGFGWQVIPDRHAVWHNGGWLGARTVIIRNTKLKNCMVILDNSSTLNIDAISKKLVKVLK